MAQLQESYESQQMRYRVKPLDWEICFWFNIVQTRMHVNARVHGIFFDHRNRNLSDLIGDERPIL